MEFNPTDVRVNPETNMIYVANHDSNTISVVDGTVNKVVQTMKVGRGPVGLGINTGMNTIYLAHDLDLTGGIYMINVDKLEDLNRIQVGDYPSEVVVNPDTNRIYVANFWSNTTSVIDGTTNEVIKQIPVGDNPTAVAVNPDTNRIYVANFWSNTTSVIDGTTNEVIKEIPVGLNPMGVTVNPETNRIYVANNWSNTTSVIDGTTNEVIKEIPVGDKPTAVAVNPDTNLLYVANWGTDFHLSCKR